MSPFQPLIEPIPSPGGKPAAPSAMAWRPEIHAAVLNLFSTIMETRSRVTPELKMLLAHVVSTAAGCRFCQAHTAFYTDRGTFFDETRPDTPERIEHVWEYQTSDLFTPAERAALDLALAAGTVPIEVPEEMRRAAQAHWEPGELVEIVAIVSFFGFTNRWHDTVGTRLEEETRAYAARALQSHGWTAGKH